MTALQNFCENEGIPSFNAKYFQTSQMSDICFIENGQYEQSLICHFLNYVYFNNAFRQKLCEKTIIFNANFQNSFQDVVY